MTATAEVSVHRSSQRLRPDPARVITKIFVPGQEGFDHEDSRTAAVIGRLLDLDDVEVDEAFDDVMARFDGRHRDLEHTLRHHASEVADRIPPGRSLSDRRRLLLGATFTSEYAIEAAALCNPSIVAHPDQTGVATGSLRFVMSVRGIGEGHRSSIGFRTGTIDSTGRATVDAASPFATTGTPSPATLEASGLRTELDRLGGDGDDADYVLGPLGRRFSRAELDAQLAQLQGHLRTRLRGQETIDLIRGIAERTYGVAFPEHVPVAERVLWPSMSSERQGMEDARFVRFTHDDGSVVYFATYTAYNGSHITQQLLETTDFCSFTSTPIAGAAAANKGLALFPRRIHGRFAALSRHDRETNAVAFSHSPAQWLRASPCQAPVRAWELLQLGNCGSPIETDAGWLVLTHGVGPMRTYSIGAILLDLDDPAVVLGRLRRPLLTPAPDERDGYVPNVVYSCGSLIHAGVLVLPYGIGDTAIGIASVPVSEVLAALADSPV